MILTPASLLNSTLTIMGIDPGIDDLGLSILTVDLKTGEITVGPTYHVVPKRWIRPHRRNQYHDERMLKEVAIRDFYRWALHQFQPHVIAIESPFLHRVITAFESLTIIMTLLRHDALEYDPDLPVIKVPPTAAKSAIGVKDFSDKEAVRKALMDRTDIIIDRMALKTYAEHSVDAIAIGLTYALRLVEALCLNSSPNPSLENSSVDLASLPSLPAFSLDGSTKTKSNRTTSSIRNSRKVNNGSTTSTEPLKPINNPITLTSRSVVNSKKNSSP